MSNSDLWKLLIIVGAIVITLATAGVYINPATARCKDGSYYYGASHHQGACSHHRGVAAWYR